MASVNDTVTVRCHGCNKSLQIPRWRVRSEENSGRRFMTFCTRACNQKFVATEGQKAKERIRD